MDGISPNSTLGSDLTISLTLRASHGLLSLNSFKMSSLTLIGNLNEIINSVMNLSYLCPSNGNIFSLGAVTVSIHDLTCERAN